MVHAHCMLDNKGYKHTLSMCNTFCFSTATMVELTPLNIMLYVLSLSCYSSHLSGTKLKYAVPLLRDVTNFL